MRIMLLGAAVLIGSCGGSNEAETQAAQSSANDARHAAAAPPPQEIVDALGRSLDVRYEILANRDGGCAIGGASYPDDGPCYEARMTLTAEEPIKGDQWSIFFSQTDPVAVVAPGEFTIEHVNGDLHRLSPAEGFTGFGEGETRTINFIVRGLALTEAKMFPNYYAAAPGADAKIIESTRLRFDDETGLPQRPHIAALSGADNHFRKGVNDATPLADAAFLFEANKNVASVDAMTVARAIIPTPKSVSYGSADARLDLSNGLTIELDGVDKNAIAAPLERLASFGVEEQTDGVPVAIKVSPHAEARKEGVYRLEISKDGVSISAGDGAGAAYGLYSIASLVSLDSAEIPVMTVDDEPRFDFRGMHVDVARNFHSKEAILKILDQMAAYKLNKLHLHLADDEGWRLEIPDLPELTEIGARRCHDPQERDCLLVQLGSGPSGTSNVDGYFSVADYKEILTSASARHIQVIPSLDMPGHARAAIKAMEARYRRFMAVGEDVQARRYLLSDFNDETEYRSIQHYNDNTINACMESSYAFVERVIDEVRKIHAEVGHPLSRYHIGADETAGAWKDSPACRAFLANSQNDVEKAEDLGAYFIERVANLLAEKGIEAGGWNDGLGHADPENMPEKIQSNAWGVLPWGGVTAAHRQANLGWDVIVSTPDVLYFDFPYEADPWEGGYYWAARRVNTRKVFNFMPENLPVHAEFWKDSNEQPFEIDDRLQKTADGEVAHEPLKPGVRFKGMQGQVWSETILTDDMLEYMVFPRLLALAERAWHEAEWEVPYNHEGAVYNSDTDYFTDALRAQRDADWARFASVLAQKELAKLDRADIAYRVPTVGAKVENGVLHANVIFPGLPIEYREEGGEWRAYEGPVEVSGAIEARARSGDGARSGRAIPVY